MFKHRTANTSDNNIGQARRLHRLAGPPLGFSQASFVLVLAAGILLAGSAVAQRGPGRGPVGPERDPEMEVTQKHSLEVARWYLTKRKAYEGARDRLQEILDQAPEFSQIDEVIYLLGEANEKLKKPEIASTYYKRVIKDYPGSQFVKKARERLADLKLPADQEEDKSKDNTPDRSYDKQPDSGGQQ